MKLLYWLRFAVGLWLAPSDLVRRRILAIELGLVRSRADMDGVRRMHTSDWAIFWADSASGR